MIKQLPPIYPYVFRIAMASGTSRSCSCRRPQVSMGAAWAFSPARLTGLQALGQRRSLVS